jgi:hypothetical protein
MICPLKLGVSHCHLWLQGGYPMFGETCRRNTSMA